MKKLIIILAIGAIGYVLFMPTIYQQKQDELEALGIDLEVGEASVLELLDADQNQDN